MTSVCYNEREGVKCRQLQRLPLYMTHNRLAPTLTLTLIQLGVIFQCQLD
jgi:hypothetical protein